MTCISLVNGWWDESSEGPYTEVLQTKGSYSVVRLYPRDREDDDFVVKLSGDVVTSFKTLEKAKDYVNNKLDTKKKK